MSAELSNNNSTTNCSEQECQQSQASRSDRIVGLVIVWIIIIVGVIGNSLVIAVVKLIRSMRTTTNYLLVNLASADITTLLFSAIHLITAQHYSTLSSPAFNPFYCKFIYNGYVVLVTLLVTSFTLTVLAIERYHALVKPMIVSRRLNTNKIAYVILGIWLVAVTLVTPLFVTSTIDPKTFCSLGDAGDEMAIYIYCLMVIITIIPFMVIAFCYFQIIYGMYFKKTICSNKSERGETREEMREKCRLVRLLILLTVVFFIAFIPYGILHILLYSKINNISVSYLREGAQYLTLLNCSVNPLIYAFQSFSYRRSFVLIFKKMFCRDTTVDDIELREMRTHSSLRAV